MNGCKPNKANQERFAAMVAIGCIICTKYEGVYTPPQIHHIEGSKDQEAHTKTIALCYHHHMCDQLKRPNPKAYTSRHPNKAAFEQRYGSEYELLKYQNSLLGEDMSWMNTGI
jgi:hypothetical protein